MKITSVDPIVIAVPFEDGGSGTGMTPNRWHTLDMVLVRICTDKGLTGWGEAFGYFCQRAVASQVRDLIAPALVGRDLGDPAALNLELQRKLALFGRYGVTIFALSGVDIALWDLKAKAEGVDLATLIAGRRLREEIEAYASLVRYGESDLVARFCEQATREGYASAKLHEIAMPAIRAGRAAMDPAMTLTIDVNCAWSEEHAASVIPELKALNTLWLEEPIFPPEDWDALRRLGQLGVAIAAGENACTAKEFERLSMAVTYPQPSVTKVGGISEFLRIAEAAKAHGVTLMPHSPYFGPGYYATLQLAAAVDNFGMLEHLYVDPQAWAGGEKLQPVHGKMAIPQRPGIGFEPDMQVLERYASL
jgi:L-alanine-DL-glutamate epimerase-like enolase superfamily enzyme